VLKSAYLSLAGVLSSERDRLALSTSNTINESEELEEELAESLLSITGRIGVETDRSSGYGKTEAALTCDRMCLRGMKGKGAPALLESGLKALLEDAPE
jgi:hypothetical protein